mmetsp:Transcript_40162/g.89109  ORF Transcript_40162/g.89109 Transcript_40162/m.89109 type:complete len:156 (+) Transcript_40162:195-662(+)|eukprot:CAMPEP_0202908086 /NCGR_PEP_ID=MMETSP1392-20130828/44838_1 /ASSEMBLY_ACC=CAM_ASM_000868 /TAXON_ID=225041 /ORGANISM="Chlamydomonas chlamydogama, Strain SAG 11-48b" /LENGTH=155 /DNA_ID=CAMNT_0049597237 /DNA_START=126 /DNA_END=593 /DNA_ORIENTATION=+
MDKYVQRWKNKTSCGDSEASSSVPSQRQMTICELKKVQRLAVPRAHPTAEEILRHKAVLDAAGASEEELRTALRQLSCYNVDTQLLLDTHAAISVKRLRQHACTDIAHLAAKLILKWRDITRQHVRCQRKSKKLGEASQQGAAARSVVQLAGSTS